MKDIKSHIRINDILLGPLERPALRWLAAHQPKWVTPDVLTLVGIFGALIIAAGFALSNISKNYLWLASLGFAINWFGDSLDGTLARYRKIERPRYGFFIDHVVDAGTEVVIILGLGISPYLRFELAALLLVSYLLMSVLVYLRMLITNVFQLSYIGLGPTELRVIAILANTFVFFFGNPIIKLPFFLLSVYDLVVAVITILLFTIFPFSAAKQAREISKLDPTPHQP